MHLPSLKTLALVFQIGLLPFIAHAQTAIERIAASPETEIERAPPIPAAVEEAIHAAAKKSQPNDYQMQRFVVNKELWAYQMLRSSHSWEAAPKIVLEGILATAKKAHPNDYSTQLYVVEQELNAYRRLLHFQPPAGVPYQVLKGIAETALKRFANQYSTQLNFIHNQISAFAENESGQSLEGLTAIHQRITDDKQGKRMASPISENANSSIFAPDELMHRMTTIGLRVDGIPWRKSRVADYWIAQMRIWNNDSGFVKIGWGPNGELNNEVCVQLKGKVKDSIDEFYVEAEFHDYRQQEVMAATVTKALVCVEQFRPLWPMEVKHALVNMRSGTFGKWKVKIGEESVAILYQDDPTWVHNEVMSGIPLLRSKAK